MGKEIKIIGDEIYYNDVLVAKLVDSSRYTVQGEFIDVINDFDKEDSYQERYEKLADALVGYGDLEEAERLVGSLKRTKDNKDTLEDIESALSSIRNALDYMYEAVDA